ncbi:hypothetical protein R1flu_007224 [Riccia fluitans]|uniref:Uncharacterized protein n=1 Tax=Riccia fluitans TaxID=41844 RepID=A0ABD1YYI0_9MARC
MGLGSVLVVGGALGHGLKNMLKAKVCPCCKEIEHRRALQMESEVQKRIILAHLIQGMYRRAKGKDDYEHCWAAHGYEFVCLKEILTSADLESCSNFLEIEEKDKYFGVLRKKKHCRDPQTPEWVGPLKSGNNWSFSGCLICHGGSSEVSSGRLPIDAHLFNPPYASLSALTELTISAFVGSINRKLAAKLEDTTCTLRNRTSILFNKVADGFEGMKLQHDQYKKLNECWSPHLYLNEKDFICNLYIPYFTKKRTTGYKLQEFMEGLGIKVEENLDRFYAPGSALLRVFLKDAASFHLIPRATCIVSKEHNPLKPLHAHRLLNWTHCDSYEPLAITTVPDL